ncbi:hypothetical protein GWK47_052250 [Chionoecetes opilio]|uniref:THAP-type domain-containing protein n=1 Tax=Chionoecetes opilio TaxID=41210 RepID=A0A8J4Y944_CHIOP|nr:hypothetical protein GWK47_052250 [Chionoecetes opilio]
MAPSVKSGTCCACGKKRSNHPGIRLHLFPKDARRRMQWMRTLDIAFERSSQTICEDHFDAKWLGTRGRLVGNAVPRPADGLEEQQPQTCLECPDAPSMDHAIDAAPMSEMQHLSLEYDATPFGVLSFSSEDHQDLHTPVSSVRASSLAEDASFRADLGSGISNGPIQPVLIAQKGRVLSTPQPGQVDSALTGKGILGWVDVRGPCKQLSVVFE